MSEHRRVSQVVNNFFTLVSIILMAVVMTLYAKFGPKEKTPVHSGLECQKQTSTLDAIRTPSLLKVASDYLEDGLYVLNGGFIEPRFGKFYLKDKITLEESNEFFKSAINITQKENPIKYLNIKYEIIENDKNNPRKQNSEKLFAGTLLSSFRIDGKEIFMMKTDFLEYDKNEIKNRIDCTIKAFKHNAK